MNFFKKSFLFVIGSVAIAFEEGEKEVKKQRERIEKLIKREEPEKAPKTA